MNPPRHPHTDATLLQAANWRGSYQEDLGRHCRSKNLKRLIYGSSDLRIVSNAKAIGARSKPFISWSRNGLLGNQFGGNFDPPRDARWQKGRPADTAPRARTIVRTGLPGIHPVWPWP